MKKFIGRYILGLPRNKDNSFNRSYNKVVTYERDFDFWFRVVLFGAIAGTIFILSVFKPEGFNTVPEDIRQDYINSNYPKNFYKHRVLLASTPAPKPLVKVAYTREYTYEKHANKPYYDEIIAELRMRYVNWQDAAELVAKESGFNPFAINPTSGSCGLAQSLPCAKMGCELSDINCQLDWQWNYIANRYGTITNALAFHQLKGWY